MILQTKYFDLETDMFSFKNPESIRQRLEEKYRHYFTDEPNNETITYYDSFKIHLKYKRINDCFLFMNFDFPNEELLFPEVGCIDGYKITLTNYSCRGFKYELNHTYSMEEDPVPCERGFHFCKELADCFNYYRPEKASFEIERWNLDVLKFLKVKSNDITYKLGDKYCTNNITIIEECTTEEILRAFHKWMNTIYGYRIRLRGEFYEYHDGIFNKVIPGEKLSNQPTWYIYYEEEPDDSKD